MVATRSVTHAKSHFAECIASVEAGERVVITRHGRPVAAVVPMADLAAMEQAIAASPAGGLSAIVGWWNDLDDFAQEIDAIVAQRMRSQPVRPLA